VHPSPCVRADVMTSISLRSVLCKCGLFEKRQQFWSQSRKNGWRVTE